MHVEFTDPATGDVLHTAPMMSVPPDTGDWVRLAGTDIDWLVVRRVLIPGEERCVCLCVDERSVEAFNQGEEREREDARRMLVSGNGHGGLIRR